MSEWEENDLISWNNMVYNVSTKAMADVSIARWVFFGKLGTWSIMHVLRGTIVTAKPGNGRWTHKERLVWNLIICLEQVWR